MILEPCSHGLQGDMQGCRDASMRLLPHASVLTAAPLQSTLVWVLNILLLLTSKCESDPWLSTPSCLNLTVTLQREFLQLPSIK